MIESRWNADFIATILGVVFVAIGLLGFVPNPIVYDGGYFHVNAAHNFVHLITGALLLLSPYFGVPVLMIRAWPSSIRRSPSWASLRRTSLNSAV